MDPLRLAIDALTTVLYVAGPLLAAALVSGIAIGIAQTVTQVNEQSLSFIVKLVFVGVVLVGLGSALANHLVAFTGRCFAGVESVVR